MSRGQALALATVTVGLLLLWLPSESRAAQPTPHPGIVFVFIEDRVSFEQLMAVPGFRDLARSGGAALMATDQTYRSNPRDVYLALGAGAGPRTAVPDLLARVLSSHGVAVCASAGGANATDPGLLLGAVPSQSCPPAGSGTTLLVRSDVSLIDLDEGSLMGLRLPDAVVRQMILQRAAQAAANAFATYGRNTRVMVLVVVPKPSFSMERVGDEVTPLIMSEGGPNPRATGSLRLSALTSDTTRHDGLVANVDVAPTILQFFGIPIPSEMDGQPIRRDGMVDLFALHRLHLEQRHIRLPIQLGELGFVSALGIAGIPLLVALARRGSLPPRIAAAMRYATLCGVAFGIVVLGGGLLPRFTWPVVIPYVVVATVGLAAASLAWLRRGAMAPFVFLGAVGLGFIVVEGALGGKAFGMPLLGGTMFDGVRYYGLPNAFISILLATALFVAAGLAPVPGFLVLLGAGVFAGFPGVGSDIGGSITLFAAAGIWWVVRAAPLHPGNSADRRGWPWLRMAVALVVTVAVGLAIVLLANRFLPGAPTHATRFVERTTGRFGSAASEIRHRVGVGWHMLNAVPAAYIPLVGLAAVFVLAIAGPGPIGRGLALVPMWRDVLVAMVIAAAVAFVANDTGVAASAPAFLYAATLMAYLALLPAAWARPPPLDRPPAPAREPQGIS